MPGRLATVSIVVAALAMISSFFQSWNYSRNLDVVQRNVIRSEYLRTCRDIIDAYFAIKMRAYGMQEMVAAGREVEPTAMREGEAHVFRFGALGTFLANFRDDAVRDRYTQLSWQLLAIMRVTFRAPRADFERAYGAADRLFGDMNEDCARTARLSFL